jgi:energy-coupling factor transport system substrate-specific component
MTTTPSVIAFSRRTGLVLLIASLFSAAGFVWPFFYVGENLPQTQLFFWIAVGFSLVVVVLQVSTQRCA